MATEINHNNYVEIEPLKLGALDKTKAWANAGKEDDDATRCFGPCFEPEEEEEQLEILEIT